MLILHLFSARMQNIREFLVYLQFYPRSKSFMKKSIFLLVIVMVLALCLTGCATTVTVEVERPAELDLNGAKSVGILPFQPKSTASMGGISETVIDVMEYLGLHDWYYDQDDEDRKQLTDLLTKTLMEGLVESKYLDLVDTQTVKNAINMGKKPNCDVYLTGAITKFETSVESIIRERNYANGVQNVKYYYRELYVELMYQIVDTETNRVISIKTIPVEQTSYEHEDREAVESVYDMGRKSFIEIAETILRQIQPYTVKKTISLLSDSMDDPDMAYADEMVKAGDIDYAEKLFEEIYVKRGYLEAGYNASLLLEALGDLDGAIDLMQEVNDIYHDSRAAKALKDLQDELASAKRLEHQNEIRKN